MINPGNLVRATSRHPARPGTEMHGTETHGTETQTHKRQRVDSDCRAFHFAPKYRLALLRAVHVDARNEAAVRDRMENATTFFSSDRYCRIAAELVAPQSFRRKAAYACKAAYAYKAWHVNIFARHDLYETPKQCASTMLLHHIEQ
jgi:hypothetical protein